VNQRPQRPPSEVNAAWQIGLSPGALKLTAAAALLASVLGQGLSAALPGARAGLEDWIKASEHIGATATQFFALLGVMVATQLVASSLRTARLPIMYRVFVVPAGGFSVFLCVAATQRPLPELFLLVLTLAVSFVLFFVAALGVGYPQTRWLALALGLSGFCTTIRMLSAFPQVFSFTLRHGQPSPVLAVLELLCFFAIFLAAGMTLDPGRRPGHALLLLGALGFGLAFFLAAEAARHASSGFFQVVMQRSLDNLQTSFTPWADGRLSRFLTALVLPVSAALLFTQPARLPLASAISLTLLARGSGDVPLLALQLLVAALLLPLTLAAQGPVVLTVGPRAPAGTRRHSQSLNIDGNNRGVKRD